MGYEPRASRTGGGKVSFSQFYFTVFSHFQVLHPQEGTLSLTLCDGIDISTCGEVFSSRQPVFSNLSCHLIDCDGKVQECVRPLKVSYCKFRVLVLRNNPFCLDKQSNLCVCGVEL